MANKQQKGKAIAFTFRPFLATFLIFHKWPKNSNNKTATFIFEKGEKINC
jgi:hypothetical protein